MTEDDRSGGPSRNRDDEGGLPPIDWPEGAKRPDAATADVERPPVWAEALRLQLFGLLVLLTAGFLAVSTTGFASAVLSVGMLVGVLIGVFGFYAWPRRDSNNS